MSNMIGRVLDRKYRLNRLIGEGGMGTVYEAEHTLLKRKVAVKVMRPQAVSQRESVERFLREGQATIAINHPNIVDVIDIGREDDVVFMVMELLEGRGLEAELLEQTKLPYPRAVSVAIQILSALQAAHDKGIIHRDLKTDNVFLATTPHGRVEAKLLDFGIAKLQTTHTKKDLGLTKTGNVVGTPYYLSPEQAKGGKEVDHRIDIWGVGVLLYEMISGTLPFRGENYNEILSKVLLEEPIPLGEITASVPPPLVKVIEKALCKERTGRFDDAKSMVKALFPFCERERDAMSTMVIETLDASCPPPSYPPPLGEGEGPKRVRRWKDSDPNRNTVDIDTNEHLAMSGTSELPSKRRPNRRAAVAVGLAASVAVVILVVVSSGKTDSPAPVTMASDITIVAPVAATALRADPSEPQKVRIELVGAPANANFYVNDEEASASFPLIKSSQRHRLRVAAPNFQLFETAFVPSEDRIIAIEMIPTEQAPATAENSQTVTKTRNSSAKKKKKNKGTAWESNPFD